MISLESAHKVVTHKDKAASKSHFVRQAYMFISKGSSDNIYDNSQLNTFGAAATCCAKFIRCLLLVNANVDLCNNVMSIIDMQVG